MRRLGEPLPPEAIAPPITSPFEVFCLGAFWDLGTNRAIGFGAIGPIPEWTIESYAARRGLRSQRARGAFLLIIRRLDACWLAWQREKQEAEQRQREAAARAK